MIRLRAADGPRKSGVFLAIASGRPRGNTRWYVALDRGPCSQLRSHIGGDIARTNPVNLNVVLAPLIAQGLCKLAQGAFGGRVRRNCYTTLEGKERTKVYDFSFTPRNHVTSSGLRKEPD